MKSYEEMAKSVFERRDVYLKKKKSDKKTNTALIISSAGVFLGLAILSVAVIVIIKASPTTFFTEGEKRSHGGAGQKEADGLHTDNPSSQPEPSKENCSEPTSSESASADTPSAEAKIKIDSFDKLNFYAGLLVIQRGAEGGVAGSFAESHYFPTDDPTGDPFDDPWISYTPLPDYGTEKLTVTKALYFRLKINDPENFIAEKVGTGIIEAIVTDNNFSYAITFKNGDRYYTLSGKPNYRTNEISFHSREYIEDGYAFENLHIYPHNLVLTVKDNLIKDARIDYIASSSDGHADYIPVDIVSGSQRGAEATLSFTYGELEKSVADVLE